MQIRKMTLMLAALGALSMTLTGCPEGDGRESLTCTDNAGCLENEICHPTAKVCVQTCTAGADCPDSSKTCEAIGGTSDQSAQMICKCSTDALCQTDERISDASTLTCSTTSKVCVPPGTTPACTTNADCTGGQVCDTATGTCKAPTTGATCSGEGKSTCNYGEFCSSSTCAAVPCSRPARTSSRTSPRVRTAAQHWSDHLQGHHVSATQMTPSTATGFRSRRCGSRSRCPPTAARRCPDDTRRPDLASST